MSRRLRLKIFGRVQNVNFRSQVQSFALQLGLSGQVSNQPDGSVAVVAEGEEEHLQKLLSFCYNGIRYAEVKSIDAAWEDAAGQHGRFEIV